MSAVVCTVRRIALFNALLIACVFAGCGPGGPPPAAPPKIDQRPQFRDAQLGAAKSTLKGLDRQPFRKSDLEFYRRDSDAKVINDIAVDDIRYAIYKDKLAEVQIIWRPPGRDSIENPTAFYKTLVENFGEPTTLEANPDQMQFRAIWEGQTARLTVIETFTEMGKPGRGQLTLVSLPLMKELREARPNASSSF